MSLFEKCVLYATPRESVFLDIYGNTITPTGTLTSSNDRFGISAALSGYSSSNYSTIASTTSLAIGTGDFTTMIWYYPTSQPPTNYWIFSSTTDYNFDIVPKLSGNLKVGCGGTLSDFGTNTNTLNTWYCIIVSRVSSSLSVYLNGTQFGTSLTNAGNISQTAFVIGADGDSKAFPFIGNIGEIMIIKGYGMSESESRQLYDLTSKHYICPYQRGERICNGS